jgi:TetR/AcrR family transcriptional regulator
MARPARVSVDRILAAAAAEFAERGFAGARVDRIARRARVNKAMLYYHFGSKERLYRVLLHGMFSRAADRLHAITAEAIGAAEKIDRAIAGLAQVIREHPILPAIMMREVADGGRHLDAETLQALGAVPRAFGAIVRDGVARGEFRPIDPVFAYFSVLPPLVFFLAAAPIRRKVADLRVLDLKTLGADEFIRQLQQAVRRTLAPARSARRRPRS